MVSIEEAGEMLDEIALEIPRELYKYLNGGILLFPEVKYHAESPPESAAGDLCTLGEYHVNSLGRYIIIYYGSFERVYGHLSAEKLRSRLKETLLHEFTHHIESLAGERGLEIKDAIRMQKYKEEKRKTNG